MAAPAAIGAAGSLVSSKKGGGGKKGNSGAPNLQGLYSKFSTILDAGLNMFKDASSTGPGGLRATDANALADYQKNVMTQAQSELGAYDAGAAAAGSPINKSDTAKERSRTQIATGLSSDVGNKKYGQDMTFWDRLHNLLPGTGSAAAGFGGAGALDTMNSNQQSGILDSIFKLAGSFGNSPTNQSAYGVGQGIGSFNPFGGESGGAQPPDSSTPFWH